MEVVFYPQLICTKYWNFLLPIEQKIKYRGITQSSILVVFLTSTISLRSKSNISLDICWYYLKILGNFNWSVTFEGKSHLLSDIEKWISAISCQKPVLWLVDLLGQPIKGLVFGRKWLEFISLSQIKGN